MGCDQQESMARYHRAFDLEGGFGMIGTAHLPTALESPLKRDCENVSFDSDANRVLSCTS
jgi:hypothetical protein